MCAVAVTLLTSFAGAAERFTHDFGRDPWHERILQRVGWNAGEAITETPQGLVVTLPVDKPGKAEAGVGTKFKVGGDFEITVSYELLDLSQPEKGYGTGVRLRLVKAEGLYRRADLSRSIKTSGLHRFTSAVWTKVKEQWNPIVEHYSAEHDSGRLRLSRRGSILIYAVADGDTGEFREVRQAEFGPEVLTAIEFLGDTGESTMPMSVRLTNLSIVADELPFGLPAPQRKSIWSVWILSSVMGVAAVTASGIWYWRAHR